MAEDAQRLQMVLASNAIMNAKEVIDYEVKSSPWAGNISWRWAQLLAAEYYAWKTKRKLKRYYAFKELERELEQWKK